MIKLCKSLTNYCYLRKQLKKSIMIKEINTIEDVRLFAFQLVNEEKLSFHPDNDFSDYINLETSEPAYSQEEVQFLNQLMEKSQNIINQKLKMNL